MASSYCRGGFGGLRAAQASKSELVDVTLVDRRNFHLFQPLLYQVATGSLSPGQISAPLRSVLSKQKNTRVLLGSVEDVDPDSKHVAPVLSPFVMIASENADEEDLRKAEPG